MLQIIKVISLRSRGPERICLAGANSCADDSACL